MITKNEIIVIYNLKVNKIMPMYKYGTFIARLNLTIKQIIFGDTLCELHKVCTTIIFFQLVIQGLISNFLM